MLATSSTHQSYAFLPAVPSPLSPRSANIYGRFPRQSLTTSMSSTSNDGKENKQRASSDAALPFSKRPVKKAPSPKQDELKERRRAAFLRRVQEGRDDKRFEARGDQIMRSNFLRTQRNWEAQQANAAIDLAFDYDGDEEDDSAQDLPVSSNDVMQTTQTERLFDYEQADEIFQREQDELDALIGDMPFDEIENGTDVVSEHFGSDDDEYDALFTELMESESAGSACHSNQPSCQPHRPNTQTLIDEEAMDMS